MKIWSIQTLEAFDSLIDEGVLRAFKKHAMETSSGGGYEYPPEYEWMISQMEKRVGPAPKPGMTPLWAWAYYGPEKPRPDLRRLAWYWSDQNQDLVMIEAEIPDEKILVSDFDAFHAVMNKSYLPFNEMEDEKFDKKSLSKDKLDQAIQSSWDRIFDKDQLCENYWGPKRQRTLQACFWELHIAEVVETKRFKCRTRKAEDSFALSM